MNHSLPSPLQKLIIEYCHYPRLYSKELKEKTASIYDFFIYHQSDWIDLGYANCRTTNFDKEWTVGFSSRWKLLLIKENSDAILNLKQNASYQRGYYNY